MSELSVHFVRHGESLANASDRSGEQRPDDWDRLSDRAGSRPAGSGAAWRATTSS